MFTVAAAEESRASLLPQEAGMMIIHARRIFPITDQFTDLGVFPLPTPMTDEVMTWVALIGSPAAFAKDMTQIVAIWRGKGIVNIYFADIHAHGFNHVVTAGNGACSKGQTAGENQPDGNFNFRSIMACQTDGNESHDFLGVIAAVAESQEKAAQFMQETDAAAPNYRSVFQQ